jgi:asparagine synthase (glutamine-hydrolysing)
MCGIVGLISKHLSDFERENKTAEMLHAIKHRGPDSSGISSHAPITMGMVRLSIVDLESGSQPMKLNSCKQTLEIVFNGEIYNHKQIRNYLHARGHNFASSHSDTEVILHAYEEWGRAAFSRLNGMFSVAIIDPKIGILVLARDTLGEKPLYYFQNESSFVFASEVKAIVVSFHLQNRLNMQVVNDYLVHGCNYSSNSFFSGINKVKPGHTVTVSFKQEMKVTVEPYENYVADNSILSLPVDSNLTFANLLEKSVQQRLDTDVSTGLYLSGGLDSSAIAVIAHKLSPNIQSFSVGFHDSNFDEATNATQFAKFLGLQNSQIICDEKYAIDFLTHLPDILDEPMADPSIIPTTLLSEFSSQKIKVALGGDGSDEIGYGYNTFKQFEKIGKIKKWLSPDSISLISEIMPKSDLKVRMHYLADLMSSSEESMVMKATSPLYRYQVNSKQFLPTPSISKYSFNGFAGLFEDPLIDSYISTYMREQILIKIDRASMYSSVEVRSPFLDYDLMSYMSRCSKNFKFLHGKGKLPLRTFLQDKVPKQILQRPKKGFGIPMASWMQGDFGRLLLENVMDGDWTGTSVDSKVLSEVERQFRLKKQSSSVYEYLWCLAVYQIWKNRWS